MKQLIIESSFDRTVKSLCDEIDYWQSESEFWKLKYEEMRDEHNDFVNERLKHNQELIGSTLKHFLGKIGIQDERTDFEVGEKISPVYPK